MFSIKKSEKKNENLPTFVQSQQSLWKYRNIGEFNKSQ